jgi:hypothetical protein
MTVFFSRPALGRCQAIAFLLGTIQISIQQEKWLIMPVFREDQAWFELRPKANVIFAGGLLPGCPPPDQMWKIESGGKDASFREAP